MSTELVHSFHKAAEALAPEMIERRRDFHRHPELGFQEVRTASVVARVLTELGVEVRTGVGKTGVIGLLEGERPGPTVLLRFDMDALPIQEENAVDYASTTPGVMHACGHDGHTAIGLTVARLLTEARANLAGTFKLVFQPAEEGLGGARAMVADGALEGPAPIASFGLHLWNTKPLGWVAATDGPVMSAADRFTIRLHGRGGHAASPSESRDPVVAAAQIISALQSVVSRNVDALDQAVVSVTSIHSGTAFNIIPETVEILGTVRTFTPAVRERVIQRFNALVTGLAEAFEVESSIDYQSGTKAVANASVLAARVRELAALVPGVTNVVSQERTMGSEDMSEFMDDRPGCYFFIGSRNDEKGLNYGHHHPRFDFDERALVTGAALIAATAADFTARSA
ncbi:MAG TPA: amidohydrolase [Anaerolineales bacterium]|nr:amidohydrolase [Anaerolineales bacterium]